MRKIYFLLAVIIGGVFAYANLSLGYSPATALEWIKSLFRRAYLAGSNVVSNDDPISIATAIIANFEGFSPHAYPDPPGQDVTYSIGYGHQITEGDGFTHSSEIDEPTGYAQLQADVAVKAKCVTDSVTASLSPTQTAALISLCYNIGCSAFKRSTVLRVVNSGDLSGIPDAFRMWVNANGSFNETLAQRREDEINLFNS